MWSGRARPFLLFSLEVAGIFRYPRFAREGARARAREPSPLRGRLRCWFLCFLVARLLCVRLSRRTCPLGPLGTGTGLPVLFSPSRPPAGLDRAAASHATTAVRSRFSHRVALALTWQPGLYPLPPPSLPSLPGGSEGHCTHATEGP